MIDDKAVLERRRDELNCAGLYDALGAREENEKLREIYRRLADVE